MGEIKYVHVLDNQGTCNCGEFAVPPSHPDFITLATKHFQETNEKAVKGQTGWRGLWNRFFRGR
jgi:hypothetical protein